MNTYEAIARDMAMAVWTGPNAAQVQALPPEAWMSMAIAAAARLRLIDEMVLACQALRTAQNVPPFVASLVQRWDRDGVSGTFSDAEMAQLRAEARKHPPF